MEPITATTSGKFWRCQWLSSYRSSVQPNRILNHRVFFLRNLVCSGDGV